MSARSISKGILLQSPKENTRSKAIEKSQCFESTGRETNQCFIVLVKRQNAATLLPLTRQYLVPETTIVSEEWAVYSTTKYAAERNQQETNYSFHFSDSEPGAYRNTISIQSMQQKFREGHKSRYGKKKALSDSYMNEFV